MKNVSGFILITLILFSTTLVGQPSIISIDYQKIFLNIPKEAFPMGMKERKVISDSIKNNRGSFKIQNSYFSTCDSSVFKSLEIEKPIDTGIVSGFEFYIQMTHDDSIYYYQKIFMFKIFLTPKDTFLISTYRESYTDNPFYLKVCIYRLTKNYQFERMEIPEVHPTDFALTPNDSLIMVGMIENGELQFDANFDKKGLRYYVIDHTLNFGPIEPPQHKVLKYFSDFKCINNPIRITITPEGIKNEN